MKTRTDPGGHTYFYEYDSFGRSVKIVSPDSTFSHIQYDDMSNTIIILDENQHKKEYHYDWVGNVVFKSDQVGIESDFL